MADGGGSRLGPTETWVGQGRHDHHDRGRSGVANLVVWTSLYDGQRRIILGASMMAVKGRVQREGEVGHFVAHHLTDLSAELAGAGDRDAAFPAAAWASRRAA